MVESKGLLLPCKKKEEESGEQKTMILQGSLVLRNYIFLLCLGMTCEKNYKASFQNTNIQIGSDAVQKHGLC